MTLTELSRILIISAAFDWLAVAIMAVADHAYPNPGLHERVVAAVILSGIASIGALLGWFYLSGGIPAGAMPIALAAAFLLATVPQVVWVAGLWMGKFR